MITIKLEPGQEISLLAYKGSRDGAYDFERCAARYRGTGLPMPIEGCNVGMAISNMQTIKIPVKQSRPVNYTASVEGIKPMIEIEIEWAVMLTGEIS